MPAPKGIVLATNNNKKIIELQQIIGDRYEVKSIAGQHISWQETGTTFAANALIKAQAVARHSPLPILADDSGLEVEALNGAPGVHSSRYAGPEATDQSNIDKLLEELKDIGESPAQFVCCLCYLDETREPRYFYGRCVGRIVGEQRGHQGFGYDPVFYPEGDHRSLAEYTADEKNHISHRFKAIQEWLKLLSGAQST